jgi:hypothetical protein
MVKIPSNGWEDFSSTMIHSNGWKDFSSVTLPSNSWEYLKSKDCKSLATTDEVLV